MGYYDLQLELFEEDQFGFFGDGYDVVVHPRIARLHGISEDDVIRAWETALPLRKRDVPMNGQSNEEFVTVGFDSRGRTVEIVAAPYDDGRYWLKYHAVRPAIRGFLIEYGLMGG